MQLQASCDGQVNLLFRFKFGFTFKFRDRFGPRLRFAVFKYLNSYWSLVVKVGLVSGLFFFSGSLAELIMDNYTGLRLINNAVNNFVYSLYFSEGFGAFTEMVVGFFAVGLKSLMRRQAGVEKVADIEFGTACGKLFS